MILRGEDTYWDTLTFSQRKDIYEAANEAIGAMDMSEYENAWMIAVPGYHGPQVLICPVREHIRQGNTRDIEGHVHAYSTGIH